MYRRCQNSFGCCPVGKHVVLHSMKVRKGGQGWADRSAHAWKSLPAVYVDLAPPSFQANP